MTLSSLLNSPPDHFRPYMMWFLNHRLEKAELFRQIVALHAQGAGGLILCAREGLLTPYISGEWFETVEWCIEQAQRFGLHVLIYDDMNGPSGTANGSVTDENPRYRQTSLRLANVVNIQPGGKIDLEIEKEHIESILGLTESGDIRDLNQWTKNGEIHDNVPSEITRLLIFSRDVAFGSLHGYTIDPLNPDAIKTFIQSTHERYQSHLGKKCGSVKGFFTLQPHIVHSTTGDIPWTDDLPDTFKSMFGYDIWSALPSLFMPGEGEHIIHRCRYMQCMNTILQDSFYQSIHDACQKNEWLCLGHPDFQGDRRSRFWSQYDYFKIARHVAFPSCVTYTGSRRSDDELCYTVVACKLATSIVRLMSKPYAMAVANDDTSPAGITLADLDRLAGLHLALGINQFIPHAAYYSIEGFRKRDRSPIQSNQQPFWVCYRYLTERLTQLTALISQGKHVPMAAVLYPIQTFWGLYSFEAKDRRRLATLETTFAQFCETLIHQQYDFDFLPEEFLTHLKTDDKGQLLYSPKGEMLRRYPILIIPYCRVVHYKTLEFIEHLAEGEAQILFVNLIPEASPETGTDDSILERVNTLVENYENVQFAEGDWLTELSQAASPGIKIKGRNEQILYHHRILPNGDVFLLHNSSIDQSFEGSITFPTPAHFIYHANTDTEKLERLEQKGPDPTLSISLLPGETRLFVMTCDEQREAIQSPKNEGELIRTIPLKEQFLFFAKDGNDLPLNEWKMKVGMYTDTQTGSVDSHHTYETTFFVNKFKGPLYLVCDGLHHQPVLRGHGRQSFEIRLNHALLTEQVNITTFDPQTVAYDITSHIRQGENVLTISNRARMHAPGNIQESLLIHGDFALLYVDDQYVIATPKDHIQTQTWTQQGYPFLSGTGIYRQVVDIPEEFIGCKMVLSFDEIRDMAEISINDQAIDVLWREPWTLDITDAIQAGQNVFECRVSNSLENVIHQTQSPSGIIGHVWIEVFKH